MRKFIAVFIAFLLLLSGCANAPEGSSPSADLTALATPMLTPQPTPQAQTPSYTADGKQIREDMEALAATLTENYAYASTFDQELWAEYTDLLVDYFADNAFSPESYVQTLHGVLEECLPISQVQVLDNSAYASSGVANSLSDEFYGAYSYIAQGAGQGEEGQPSALSTHLLMDGAVAYINFASFLPTTVQSDQDQLKTFYPDAQNSNALILDVRNVTGDSYEYWTQNIVSPLSTQSYTYQTLSLIMDGANNRLYMNNFASEEGVEYIPADQSEALASMENLDAERAEEMGWVKATSNTIAPARDSEGYRGTIYVLANGQSPAGFIDFCRQTGFAQVIGAATNGSAQGADYVPCVLPGTGVVICYAPEYMLNSDGSAAFVSGIEPDVKTDPDTALEKCLNLVDPSADAKEIARSVKPMNPIVTIQMNNGDIIKAELYPEIAPNSVANFVTLIESGFYDGTIFHRVIPGFMIQGGDPEGTGTGGPGYSIRGEFRSNGIDNALIHDRGVLSMARSQHKDSAGSQFFIMVAAASHLDGSYAAFGKVIEGLDAVDRIVNETTGANDRPLNPPIMTKVTVDTGGVSYSVEKLQGIR